LNVNLCNILHIMKNTLWAWYFSLAWEVVFVCCNWEFSISMGDWEWYLKSLNSLYLGVVYTCFLGEC